jgi:hypothetical protein
MTDDLWGPLADAGEAVSDAMMECAALTPGSRLKVEEAVGAYIGLLVPVGGTEPAFQFHAAFENFIRVLDEHERHLATLSGPPIDEADLALVRRLQASTENLTAAYKAALLAMSIDLGNIRGNDDPVDSSEEANDDTEPPEPSEPEKGGT